MTLGCSLCPPGEEVKAIICDGTAQTISSSRASPLLGYSVRTLLIPIGSGNMM